jgi:hypothetical protein
VGTGGAPGSGGEVTGGSSAGGSAEGGRTASAGAGGQETGSGGAVGGSMGGGGAAGPEDVLDSFEDNDGRIEMVGGRQGPWHSFSESGCSNQQPARTDKFMPKMGGANSTMYAAHSSGSGCGKFGGIGFELNNATTTPDAMQSMAFNASGYRGISFWAKGNCNLRVEFGQKSFIPTANGGSCTSNCWNVYGSRKAQGMVPASDWKQFTILFSELEREEGPKMPAFDPGQLIGIAFKCEGAAFDFWLDEIQFAK